MGIASGIGNYKASKKQSAAAQAASDYSKRQGLIAEGLIKDSEAAARDSITAGFDQSRQDYLDTQARNEALFQPQRDVGNAALERLQRAVLQGDQSAVELDPGYQFRLAEGNKAIERAASAAGSFGSGGNLKDFSRFNQGLASDEYARAISRLQSLQQMGSQATANLASQNSALGQNMAITAANRGNTLADLSRNIAIGRSNAVTGAANSTNHFNIQTANAQAQQSAGVGQSIDNTIMAALAAYTGGAAKPAAKPSNTPTGGTSGTLLV
jgi:hypothetical protein